MNLSDFTAKFTVPEDGYSKYLQTHTGGRLHNIIGNEGRTETLLATFFWQIFLLSAKLPPHDEIFIVTHGNGQYSLVILGDFEEAPKSYAVKDLVSTQDLLTGYKLWRIQQSDRNTIVHTGTGYKLSNDRISTLNLASVVDEDYTIDITRKMNMQVLLVKNPAIEYTNNPQSTLGSPCPAVTATPGGKPLSTAGIFTSDNKGRFGATVAWHSVKDLLQTTTEIYINDELARIVSTDQISDSCFAVFDNPSVRTAFNAIGGTLSGLAPRMYDPVTFQGITSGFKQTIINSWSPDIPFVLPYSQLKVLTGPETNPGDSGAALIDRDGMVVGFSFFRTALNQQPEYSSWIWADSVYKAHNLIY